MAGSEKIGQTLTQISVRPRRETGLGPFFPRPPPLAPTVGMVCRPVFLQGNLLQTDKAPGVRALGTFGSRADDRAVAASGDPGMGPAVRARGQKGGRRGTDRWHARVAGG